jgi:hypothetical protein
MWRTQGRPYCISAPIAVQVIHGAQHLAHDVLVAWRHARTQRGDALCGTPLHVGDEHAVRLLHVERPRTCTSH